MTSFFTATSLPVLLALLVATAVGFVGATDTAVGAWATGLLAVVTVGSEPEFTTIGSIEGMGFPNLVCSLTT